MARYFTLLRPARDLSTGDLPREQFVAWRRGRSAVYRYEGETVGTFQSLLEPKWLKEFWPKVESSEDLIQDSGTEPNGPSLCTIGVGEDDEPPRLVSVPSDSDGGVLGELAAACESAIALTLERPLRVLRGAAEWADASIPPGVPLKLSVTLLNCGSAPLSAESPTRGIVILQRTRPKGFPSAHDDVVSTEVALVPAESVPPVVTLPGDGTISASMILPAYLPPGNYNGSLKIYLSDLAEDPEMSVFGTLEVALPPLLVRASARTETKTP